MKRTDASAVRSTVCSAGFTVAELVVASAILFTVLVGVLGAVEYAGASTAMASMRQDAINVAVDQIEADRNLPYDHLGIVYGDGSVGMQGGQVPEEQTITTERGTYTVNTEIWWPDTTKSTYKAVRVTVSWTEPVEGNISIETAVFGQVETGNVGDVRMEAVDVESPTDPVAGARVILDPNTGSNMTRTSAADGVLFFGQVPVGAASFPDAGTVNSTWLVDVDGLGTPTIQTGTQNLGFVYCQKPCTAKIHVRSTSAPSVQGATVTLVDTDRSITYTAVTDADGWAWFNRDAGTVNGTAGLWLSSGGGYSATAEYGGLVSAPGTFALATGGECNDDVELVVTEPPSVTVSKVIAATGDPLNGVEWTVELKDPSGGSLGVHTTTDDSYTFQVSVAGNYTAIVTDVTGYADNPGYTFYANAVDQNQPCEVPMQSVFVAGVRLGSTGLAGQPLTLTNVGTGITVPSVLGDDPGITGSDGTVQFPIPVDGTYQGSTVVNNITYTGSEIDIVAASPPASPYYVDITPGTISVGVRRGGGSRWRRYVAIYDSNDDYVAYGTATYSNPTVTFSVPGGMYTVVVCGTRARLPLPSTRPADRRRTYKNYYMTPPGVPTDGGTYYFYDLQPPN